MNPELAEILRISFTLYWVDLDSTANKLRVFVEKLLTDFKVKKYVITKGKRKLLNLHQRLDYLKSKNIRLSGFRDNFLAIKWIGNEGSHNSKFITHEKLIKTFEILEEVLENLYEEKNKKLEKDIKQIIKNKGKGKG